MEKKYIDVFERHEWRVTELEGWVEIETWSPAGENLVFYINGKNIPAEIRELYEGFDPDDHAGELYEAGKNGLSGVPSLSVLVKDAAEIEEMLENLCIDLHAAKNK